MRSGSWLVSSNRVLNFIASQLSIAREARRFVFVAQEIIRESVDVVANALGEILETRVRDTVCDTAGREDDIRSTP